MIWSREEYIAYMNFEDVGKQMFCELFGPLIGLEQEWTAQGATREEIEMTGFDWDYVPTINCGANLGLRGGFKERVLENNSEYYISTDKLGRTMKLCKNSATIPLPLDYPVKNIEDWLKIKPFYEYHDDRIDWERVELAKSQQAKGTLVCAFMEGGFDLPRQLLGEEELCIAYYEQPELIYDILETAGNMSFRVLEQISDKLTIDNLSIHEDMAGKSGSLIGPLQINQFIKPFYLKQINLLKSKGTKLFSQDSDGNMNSIIADMIISGISIMYPAEPAAGMDIVEIRKKYGRKVALKGGIDKHILRRSKAEIEQELEDKMQPLMQGGGTVFGLDHRITNGTPIENYRYYVNLGRVLLGREPLKSKGWGRMAF